MKRSFAFVLALLLLFAVPVFADLPDLSGLSFDELIALRDQLNLAIWSSDEWQEVAVPVGIWEVGKDIPAGHWMITPPARDFGQVFYCQKYIPSTKKPDHSHPAHTCVIAGVKSSFANNTVNYVDYDMEDGWFFINEVPVTFTPFIGKPDLNFKK